eukprot:1618899-Pyramimonas_sp.AAC.1
MRPVMSDIQAISAGCMTGDTFDHSCCLCEVGIPCEVIRLYDDLARPRMYLGSSHQHTHGLVTIILIGYARGILLRMGMLQLLVRTILTVRLRVLRNMPSDEYSHEQSQ